MDEKLLDAYFAGIIDGEGNVGVYVFKSGVIRPVIKVDMTCEKTIRAIHAHFGGYIGSKKIESLPNRQPQWRWEVTFAKAKTVAARILPYLISKKDGAELILSTEPKPRGRPKKTTQPQ